jgi:2-polyprenyl-6-hydroxyphenyl methylase / 3-demethylubiquinone-9 3-methyltransferase
MQDATHATVAPAEVAHFNAMAAGWWDPEGPSKALFALNPARIGYIRERASRHFRLSPGRRPFAELTIVDVGCGGGIGSEAVARLGGKIIGVDAAVDNIAVARAHAQEAGLDIDYREGTAGMLADSGFTADIVIALEVIEHVADPAHFLRDLARLMKPDGLLILSTPNRTARSWSQIILAAEYIFRLIPRGSHDWQKFITPDEMQGHLAGAGLERQHLAGISLDPLRGNWSITSDSSVDYILTATHRPG